MARLIYPVYEEWCVETGKAVQIHEIFETVPQGEGHMT
jgi:hypothetical protein